MLTTILIKIPKSLKLSLKRIALSPLDLLDFFKYGSGHLAPPRGLNYSGAGDYIRIGNEFLTIFKETGSVRPQDTILDIGCGIGRMAVPFTRYLTAEATYNGFDIVPEGIAWCTKNITRRFPNFKFQLSDIYNKSYNPDGKILAKDYSFPFDNLSFDFIFATSVFTHLLPEDTANYLREASRVLKKGKTGLFTFFLLNKESRECIRDGKSFFKFRLDDQPFSLVTEDMPENAIAYDETWLKGLLHTTGLHIKSIHYGSWCGREKHLSFQDIVVVTKS
jgi:SAM-dependent methyltransferase